MARPTVFAYCGFLEGAMRENGHDVCLPAYSGFKHSHPRRAIRYRRWRGEPSLTQKLNAYVGCINRLSERSYDSRARYFSWVGKEGPTGKERIIYGTYTIYDSSGCKKSVEEANAVEPHLPDLEAAASAYVKSVVTLEPAEGGGRLLRPGKLQRRQDDQGQSPASSPRGGVGCVRGRRSGVARRPRCSPGQARP